MIIDNIIVIIVAIILITYLSINYVKKYAPENLLLISIVAFCLGIYLPVNYVKKYAPLNLLFIAIGAFALGIYVPTVYYGTQVNILTQVLLLLGIFIVPTIGSIIQYKDISFGVKLLYTRAKKYYNLGKYNKCIATVEKILNKYEKTRVEKNRLKEIAEKRYRKYRKKGVFRNALLLVLGETWKYFRERK